MPNTLGGWKVNSLRTRFEALWGSTVRIAVNATGIGFFGVTPVARPSAYTQTYSTASKTVPNPTGAAVAGTIPAGGTGAAAGGWDTAGNRDTAITTIGEIKTTVNNLVTDHANLQKVVTALIDDLQALGLVQ